MPVPDGSSERKVTSAWFPQIISTAEVGAL